MNHGRVLGLAPILIALVSSFSYAQDFASVPGEYVVKLKSKAAVMNTTALAQTLGAQIKRTVSENLGIVLVQRPTVELTASAVQTLSHNPMVEYAEPNYIYRVSGGNKSLPTDPQLNQLWGMVNTGQSLDGDSGTYQAVAGLDIDATHGWQIETGSKKVVVAVIDTGVNYNEPDLQGNIWTNEAELNGVKGIDDDKNGFVDDIHGWDFVNKTGDPMDVFGHGTHCSGTIGARANDGLGVVGVAWDVSIMPIRFLGDDGGGNLADAVSAIDYAIKMKANIMNNSWGGGAFAQSLLDVITKAKDAGILFVAAAGNDAGDNDSIPSYPASYQVDNVIAVAAIDPTGAVASFSNYGHSSVQIAAPGVYILSHTMKGLESWSGTSMATPHVTGVAALLLSQDSTQTYAQIKSRILKSARPLASLRGRVATGGLVNAYYALSNTPPPPDANDPFNWDKSVQDTVSSAHPYINGTKQTWTLSVPGAKEIAVYFTKFVTEGGYDRVTFTNKKGKVVGFLTGNLGEAYSPVIDGDTVTITFTSDSSNTDYGFDVGGISFR